MIGLILFKYELTSWFYVFLLDLFDWLCSMEC